MSIDLPLAAIFDPQGRLIISEHGGHRIATFDKGVLGTLAGGLGSGYTGDGLAATGAAISYPSGVAWQGPDLIFADGGNYRLRKVAADGTMSTVVGAQSVHNKVAPVALAADARMPVATYLTHPDAVAVAPDGRLYWSSMQTQQIYRLAIDGMVELVAGKGPAKGGTSSASDKLKLGPAQEATGPAKEASVPVPMGLAFDPQGNLYVADAGSLLIRKITGLDGNAPVISRFAGTSSLAAFAPGAPDEALLLPAALVFDGKGNLYVAELGTAAFPLLTTITDATAAATAPTFSPSFARIRRLGPDGKWKTIAGPGSSLYPDPLADDGLILPEGLAIAPDGRLAIMDSGSNLVHLLPAGSY
ncbi:MAG: repeat protein [Cyanobacteria bacterium RYN_339]|nr:repeat protein [Cyanobacteria bacterium RYN_339]